MTSENEVPNEKNAPEPDTKPVETEPVEIKIVQISANLTGKAF